MAKDELSEEINNLFIGANNAYIYPEMLHRCFTELRARERHFDKIERKAEQNILNSLSPKLRKEYKKRLRSERLRNRGDL